MERSDRDGVRLAVISNRLQGIVRRMMNTLARTGRSGVLNTAKDFSCCIVTGGHDLLVSAESLPIHVMSGPDIMSRYVAEHHEPFARGDAFLHNDPYNGNSHAADHCLLVPVLDDDGRHRFTVIAKAHQADCGNSQPTTYMAAARDVYEEGALIFPAVKVQEEYADRADIIRMCRARIRVPDQWWGDYLALLGAARIGERELLSLGDDVGWSTLEEFTTDWFDYSEDRMASSIARLPEGSITAHSTHDPFPGAPDGIPIQVTVRTDPSGGRVVVDLRANPDCLDSGLNLTEATARTAAMIGVFNSIGQDVPPNAGSFRRLDVLLRENCVVGSPVHPHSCSLATSNVADRVANPVQRAFAELQDGTGMAEAGLVIPASLSVISGRDPRHGDEHFINQVFLGFTGGAAGPLEDAWLTIGHVGNAGMLLKDSVEIDELHHPIRVNELRIVPDTEGAGRRRGAPSCYAEFEPVGGPIEVMYTSDGTVNPALGARGGLAGGKASQFVISADGTRKATEPCGHVMLHEGERLASVSCGGGGYGSPRDREPERVALDVREGWVSVDRARDVYGVAVVEGQVDREATAGLRVAGRREAAEGAEAHEKVSA